MQHTLIPSAHAVACQTAVLGRLQASHAPVLLPARLLASAKHSQALRSALCHKARGCPAASDAGRCRLRLRAAAGEAESLSESERAAIAFGEQLELETQRAQRDPQRAQRAERAQRAPAGPADYQRGDVLGGKYRVLETIGRGANGVTYKAEAPGGKEVAVKALSLRGMADWKALDRFEREAAVLRSLAHPGIPAYLDYFEEDSDSDRGFFLVQELAVGSSLAELVRGGWRPDEAEVARIARELLAILDYLASRKPPVTHRDVKPENIVLEGGKAGGRVYLVDFGGVQAAAGAREVEAGGDGAGYADLGSTVVGTWGYMAPEQFRGAASPASDLYGLGATLLFLLSGKPPSAFPQERLRIDWAREVRAGADLAALLDGLLEPLVEDRLTAQEAIAILRDGSRAAQHARVSSSSSGTAARQPAGGRAVVRRSGATLEVDIPPARLSGGNLYTGAFALTWNAFVGIWTAGALASGGLLFALFSVPFWGAGITLARSALGGSLVKERLEVGRKRWRLTRQLPFLRRGSPSWLKATEKVAEGRTDDLRGARLQVSAIVNGVPQMHLELVEGVRRHVFGEALDPAEQRWLASEVGAHIKELTGAQLEDQPGGDEGDAARQGQRPRRQRLLRRGPDGRLYEKRTRDPFTLDPWSDEEQESGFGFWRSGR